MHHCATIGKPICWSAPFLCGLLLMTGCQPAPATKLVGKWQADPATGVGKLMTKTHMTLEFQSDGKLFISSTLPVVGEVRKSGTWKFLSADGPKVKIEVQLENTQTTAPLEILVIDNNTLEMVPPATAVRLPVRFQRVGLD